MSFTKEQILAEIRTLLNETSPGFWLDAEINNWIDQGALDISAKTLCIEDIATIALAAGTPEYNFPAGAIKIAACHFNGKGLVKIKPHQVGHISTKKTGEPEFWYPFARLIGVYPVPDASREGKKIKVYFHALTSDIAEIPDEFQSLGILFGLRNALLKDRKWASAAQVNGIYLNNAGFGRQDLVQKPGDAKEDYKVPDYKAGAVQNA
jgi:hypothetical protein